MYNGYRTKWFWKNYEHKPGFVEDKKDDNQKLGKLPLNFSVFDVH